MAKQRVKYACSNCGAISSTWAGKCQSCGEWNTLQEELVVGSGSTSAGSVLKTVQVAKIAKTDNLPRLKTTIDDVDSVLGGGVVPGSINLLAGQPGIGKSTLLLQVAYELAKNHSVLYVSGEESAHQIGLRAARLGMTHPKLELATSTSADDINSTISAGKYKMVIVDSIQTISCADISAAPGSVSQITNAARLITSAAKQTNTAVLLIGHVTKEGSIAGPKVLEHVVDVVLQLEGDRYGGFKILRAIKNRYGSTNEAGIFEMQENGLVQVKNPSAALLEERQISDGSIVLATMEGSRPLLVEIQALVNTTVYGYPKRTASGYDLGRLNLLIAMLEKRTKLKLADKDIYINVVGGIKVSEPAADLAICLAIGSAAKGLKLNQNAVVFGEVGLSGEVRHVPFVDKRTHEAKKLGFKLAIGPKDKSTTSLLRSVSDVRSALNTYLQD